MDALRPYLGWLIDHTYAVVFIGTLIDATGLPFPGRILLAAAGAFAAAGEVNLAAVIALGALAAVMVDHVWYFAGSLAARPVLALYKRLTWLARTRPPRLADVRRFGAATIVTGRFFSSVRMFVWPVARHSGVGYGRFLVADVAGALGWSATWVGIGYVVGDNWEPLVARLGVVMMLVVPLMVLAAFVTARLYRRARHNAAEP